MPDKILWTPWRSAYVTRERNEGSCVFCDKFSETEDRDNLILLRGKHTAVVMNLFPYNNGHIMVLPLAHKADISELTEAELSELYQYTALMTQVIRKVMKAQGFNIGINMGAAAGAGIAAHLHQHVVPRWSGDTNLMPVVAGVKVISETLNETYDKLYNELNSISHIGGL